MKYKTIKEATQAWVNGFNAVSRSLLERAFKNDIDNWYEYNIIVEGDEVYYNGEFVIVKEVDRENEKVTIEYKGKLVEVDEWEVYKEQDSWLPMWGYLWTFGESIDEEWARENPEEVIKCGFRMFEDMETGEIYLGIDGAGYNFYTHHWIPLYRARGLQWHEEEKEE